MRIKDVMTRNPVTADSETLVLDAQKIMKENNIRRLPIVDRGKLVGIVTYHDLLEASPSPATSLSIHELNYLVAKMKVKEIMKRNPVTITPDTPFEEALRLGQEKKIGSFPVVENGKLVGITTESDIVRFVTSVLGVKEEGSRITIEGLGGKLGDLEKIVSVTNQHHTIILSMMSLARPEKKDWMIVLRLKTNDPDPIVKDFKKAGFNVTFSSWFRCEKGQA
ncbi:MAG TPA: CBS and ACT domain-containing protein [Thermodesulfobacteriota bacterium]|jgi:acetoin utilization protein AcuB|nr:CBS and ACT domain-containing protein [Thermodesulfobacteriota bacterium]